MEQEQEQAVQQEQTVEINPPGAEIALERIKNLYPFVEKLHPELGPKLAEKFLVPNMVLTLADARGKADFDLFQLTQEQADEIRTMVDEINKLAQSMGIRVESDFQVKTRAYDGKPFLSLYLSSLPGYAWASKQSKLPGVTAFVPKSLSDWQGLNEWYRQTIEQIKEYWASRVSDEQILEQLVDHTYVGVSLGYPDRAILDMQEEMLGGERLTMMEIPLMNARPGAAANYDVKERNLTNPEIMDHQKAWGDLLYNFYRSDWYQDLEK